MRGRAVPFSRLRSVILSAALTLAAGLVGPAFAQSGGYAGGLDGAFGAPGPSSATGAGTAGGNGAGPESAGGGGGGAGVTGGNGGNDAFAGGSGAGATTAGASGAPGTGTNGAGGGGGAHAAVTTTTTTNAVTLTGGNGGAGDNSTGAFGGGGGGAGGYGEVVNGAVGFTNNGTITGGNGGNGGSGSFTSAGEGGDAGFGVDLVVGGATLTNNGTITGGKGGNGGNGTFSQGGGGEAGVAGSNATINNTGTIAGGNGGTPGAGPFSLVGVAGDGIAGSNLSVVDSGAVQAGLTGGGVLGNALNFTGGANTLTLQTGWSLTGNIAVTGSLTFNQSIAPTLSNVITGTGSVIQDGAGTLTLTGANTYTGGTTISTGTLTIGNNTALGTGTLTMAAGTTLSWVGGSNFTIANNIAINGDPIFTPPSGTTQTINGIIADGGTPGIVKMNGAGTLVLGGANTYTGGTNINAGTLALSSTGSIADSSGVNLNGSGTVFDVSAATGPVINALTGVGGSTVNLGGVTLAINQTGTATFGGAFAGNTGSQVFLQGAGTEVLTGVSTTTGSFFIDTGKLSIGAGGSIASAGSVFVNGGSAFDISAGGNQTVNNLGGIGAGMVTLGANTLTIIDSGAGLLPAIISGTGGVTLQGPGSMTLSGDNTYSGATNVASGALFLASGGSIAASSGVNLAAGTTFSIANGSGNQTIQDLTGAAGSTLALGPFNLTVGTADSTIFAGTITGLTPINGLIKEGSGTLSLTGNSGGFAGITTVDAGALGIGPSGAASASLGGAVSVASGGSLFGLGTIGGTLTNAGTVIPGGALIPAGTIGTLTVGGSYTQGANGTLTIEVSPSAASKLAVGGAASLAGKLALMFDPGVYTPTTYTLLTASSLTGTFSTVTGTNPSGLAQSILYGGDPSVFLQLGAANPTVVAPTNDTAYSAATSIAVMNAQEINGIILDRIGARQAGVADGQIAALTQGGGLGETAGGLSATQLAQAGGGNSAALGEVAAALPGALSSQGAWFRGIGGFASVNGSSSAPGFTGETGGFLAGYDSPVGRNAWLGVAGGYLHSDIDEHSTSSGTEGSVRLNVYGGLIAGPSLLSATAGYANDRFQTNRGIAGMGTANESHSGNEGTAAGQWSLPLTIAGYGGGTATLTPKVGLEYLYLSEEAFSETGASGFDLSASGHGTNSLQPYVSVALAQKFVTAGGTEIAPELRLGYAHELFDARLLTVTTVSGAAFSVEGVRPSRDQLTAGLGIVMQAAPNLSAYADYDTILHTGNTTEQVVQAGLRLQF